MNVKGKLYVHGSLPSSTFRLIGELDQEGKLTPHVKTSSVQKMECIEGVWYATTYNSLYQLEFRHEEIIDFIRKRHPHQFEESNNGE